MQVNLCMVYFIFICPRPPPPFSSGPRANCSCCTAPSRILRVKVYYTRFGDEFNLLSIVVFQISNGQRHFIKHYSLKTRHFIGNTSMDAQLALVMANMAKVSEVLVFFFIWWCCVTLCQNELNFCRKNTTDTSFVSGKIFQESRGILKRCKCMIFCFVFGIV